VGLIFTVPDREPHPITGLVAHRFECGRYSEYYLFHPTLRAKPCEGVEIKRNKRNTAWIILPNGRWRLLVLQGNYATKGWRATGCYSGLYVSQVLAPPEVQVLTEMSWLSRSGDLGASLLVLAAPKDIDPRTPLARVLVTERRGQKGYRLVLVDGSLVEDFPVDWEIGASLDQLLSEKERGLEP